ncbi:MAG: hypothetical protein IKU39_04265, partial [Lachnospiraceae bacterium]|nr:hypothetical protein [Lachnospiraceae bacterium]
LFHCFALLFLFLQLVSHIDSPHNVNYEAEIYSLLSPGFQFRLMQNLPYTINHIGISAVVLKK